ncbi:MAG: biotin/lipoyl-containing protein [Candidatus Omnitrophota bacterium]|nr:biotin/lipoyl-containing protein [Candidatus Omnitrophota bacterium]
MKKIILPQLGEGIEDAVISLWHLREGDTVKAGDDIVEVVTDKATFNVPSDSSGVIKKIIYAEGDTVKVGDVLAELE